MFFNAKKVNSILAPMLVLLGPALVADEVTITNQGRFTGFLSLYNEKEGLGRFLEGDPIRIPYGKTTTLPAQGIGENHYLHWPTGCIIKLKTAASEAQLSGVTTLSLDPNGLDKATFEATFRLDSAQALTILPGLSPAAQAAEEAPFLLPPATLQDHKGHAFVLSESQALYPAGPLQEESFFGFMKALEKTSPK